MALASGGTTELFISELDLVPDVVEQVQVALRLD